jgi:hypothetical protein
MKGVVSGAGDGDDSLVLAPGAIDPLWAVFSLVAVQTDAAAEESVLVVGAGSGGEASDATDAEPGHAGAQLCVGAFELLDVSCGLLGVGLFGLGGGREVDVEDDAERRTGDETRLMGLGSVGRRTAWRGAWRDLSDGPSGLGVGVVDE